MSVNGLTLGLTKPLCNGLGGGVARRGSSAPTYPATGLLQLLEPSGVNLPTGWTATTGPSCTVGGGTATNTANGVTLASGWLLHSAVTLPANTPLTVVAAVYRVGSAPNHAIIAGSTTGSGKPWLGQIFGGDQFYMATDPSSWANFALAATGNVLIRIRRDASNVWYAAWTGQSEIVIAGYITNDEVSNFTTVGALSGAGLYSADTTAFKARAISSTDLVTDGTWADAAAWFLNKTGMAL